MNNPDNTLIEFTDTQQTMTSVEIAEVTGKQHKNVLQAIRNMEPAWEKTAGLKFQLSEYKDKSGKMSPMYVLTKTETLYIATKFNDEARARLVIRWELLERSRQPQQPVVVQQPDVMPALSRRQLLLMALQAEEECQRLSEQNRLLQVNMTYLSLELGRRYQIIRQYAPETLPLVRTPDYLPWQKPEQPMQAVAPVPPDAPQTYTATQLAKEYGMKAQSFNNLLQQLGVQYTSGGQWLLATDYAGRGYTHTKQITVHDGGHPRQKPFMVWTEQGRRFLHDTLSRQGIQPSIRKGGEK